MKTALVTGLSKGIGRAITEKLIKENYFIHGTYNTDETGARELKDKHKEIEIYQCDFSLRENVLMLLEKLKNNKYDAIVNNAGTIIFETFDKLTTDTWDKIMNINLNTPFLICHSLKENINPNGSIVNIVSTDGLTGTFNSIPYSVSKAGLINLTKSLANNFGSKKIRVNSIAPRWAGSGMGSPAYDIALKMTPLARLASYDEIADVVYYLLSDKASFINGENIVVDGGYANVDSIMKREAEES